jgi:hypothetical protein
LQEVYVFQNWLGCHFRTWLYNQLQAFAFSAKVEESGVFRFGRTQPLIFALG